MTGTAIMSPETQEMLEEYLRIKSIVTYDDVATHFEVHYMTARDWIQQLINQGVVSKYPLRRGRKDQFAYTPEGDGTRTPTPIRVQWPGGSITLSEAGAKFASSKNQMQRVAGMLSYLLMRSLHLGTENEHLAGRRTALEVRKDMTELRNTLKARLDTIEQLLTIRALWEEGPELAARWGPMETEMDGIIAFADAYRHVIGEL
jgi:hypothetical protein